MNYYRLWAYVEYQVGQFVECQHLLMWSQKQAEYFLCSSCMEKACTLYQIRQAINDEFIEKNLPVSIAISDRIRQLVIFHS